MKIMEVAPGSKFEFKGNEYELAQMPVDGGFNWKDSDGFYKLTQCFYFKGNPTPEQI